MTDDWTVIHALTHSTFRRNSVEEQFQNGWHVRLGKAIHQYTDYEVECWTVDYEAPSATEAEDGITYRRFKSRLVPGTGADVLDPYVGAAKLGIEISVSLVRELRRRVRSDERTAVHLHSDTYANTYLSTLLCRQEPLFLQHHGGLRGALQAERILFPSLDHAFVLTDAKREYLIDKVGLESDRVSVRQMGVDFDSYRPRSLSPSDLGYTSPHLLLYVGKYDEYKGFDRILDAIDQLQREVILVALGGSADDPLYDTANTRSNVQLLTEYVSEEKLINLYNAASAYVSVPLEKSIRNGDCGIIAPVEALACGTPVISPTLRFFPADVQSTLGVCIEPDGDVVAAIQNTLDNDGSAEGRRQVAREYYSWERVAEEVASVYDDRLQSY